MPKLDEQISTLQQKLQQLKLRQQRTEARKLATAAVRERKAETRRKFLLGGMMLGKLRQGLLDRQLVHGWLDQTLTRAADRALFELPAVATEPRASAHHPPGESQATPGLEGNDGHGIR